tara:strand:+ start:179 stop:364 length:186 start_codon:yes stop_codon:yes gene_type:complete
MTNTIKTKGKSMRYLFIILGTLPIMFYFVQSWGLVPTIVFELMVVLFSIKLSSIYLNRKKG